MAHLADLPDPKSGLQAITINGAIHVESADDLAKRRERRKNRKSRWSDDTNTAPAPFKPPPSKKSNIVMTGEPNKGVGIPVGTEKLAPQMSTMIDANSMDEKSLQIYLLKMQIQEASAKLNRPDLGIPANPRERSPSPEPVYNSKGVRINTREERVRNELINQRNTAITKLKTLDPTYQPPSAFRYKNTQLEDRVSIPADEYPHINFIGLLLGPRGNFLEELKAKTKCNIIIRGRGSLKSGMTGIARDGKKFDAMDEPLHALITGATAEDVKTGVKEVQELIDMQVYNPDCEKAVALRSKHMHELAVLNGTLRDIDLKCLNCGRLGHKTWQCDESSIFTASVICSACGGVGHVTYDCKQRRPGVVFNKVKSEADPAVLDQEYQSFVSDLDGGYNKGKEVRDKYIPPMGDLSQAVKKQVMPLMLTHGSSAPGAASAKSRAISTGQTAGGSNLQVVGKSIFGGKMTCLTAGYKSQAEREVERKKKIDEYQNRPVPLEWQVERYEKHINKQHQEYLQRLDVEKAEKSRTKFPRVAGPPPPPPGSDTERTACATVGLPDSVGTPIANLWRRK